MSTPFDINPPGDDPVKKPASPQPNPQMGRASDLLRGDSRYAGSGGSNGSKHEPGSRHERRPSKFDDTATAIFVVAILLSLVSLGYLLWGVIGGPFDNPAYRGLPHIGRQKFLDNISLVSIVLDWALIVAVAMWTFLSYDEEITGYAMVMLALLFYSGFEYGGTYALGLSHFTASDATKNVFAAFMQTAIIPTVPGVCLIVFDIYQRIVSGLEMARLQRKTLRFGQKAARDTKPRNQFLGPCWNMPFCRDTIRGKCPIFLKKRGPCWRNKRGCMCDESIQVLAVGSEWKKQRDMAIGLQPGARPLAPQLTKEQKNERCRQCVIYNRHEEQKYKLLVGTVFVGTAALVLTFNVQALTVVTLLFAAANSVMSRFSFDPGNGQGFSPNTIPVGVQWVILVVIALVVISKLLQMVEYCCFKIKI